MKTLIGGLVLTTALGLVGCSDPKESQPGNVENKQNEVEAKTDAKLAKSLKDLETNVAFILDSLKKNQQISSEELVKMIEKKVIELLAPLKDSKSDPEGLGKIKGTLSELSAVLNTMNQDKSGNSEQISALLARLGEFEKNLDLRQTPFYKACVASINVPDADEADKRKVLNAIAFINTSKFARATEITQRDFDNGSAISYGSQVPGVVFSGTRSEFRKVDDSYTYYAFSRLPSLSNFDNLRYHSFTTENGAINGIHADHVERFITNDRDNNYTTTDLFTILNEQNPLKAIDANKIESYNRTDCDRIATYMANVGSKALTSAIDTPNYLASLNSQSNGNYVENIRTRVGGNNTVSDIFAWLDFRNQEAQFPQHSRKGHTDSPRVMVIQDNLLRPNVDGVIDYGFLDLVDAPHLRFLAALDSEIGKARVEDGEDFDNAYKGKNESLINFVTRHRNNVELARNEKGYKDLEAVFINFVPEVVKEAEPEVKKKGHNLFHTP